VRKLAVNVLLLKEREKGTSVPIDAFRGTSNRIGGVDGVDVGVIGFGRVYDQPVSELTDFFARPGGHDSKKPNQREKWRNSESF